ncbi:MAG: GNAT family N-acetyltransferase [Clostridiaceae bacterium]|nr:GNAT family N-acetyltransferase [Clostridiaceae bacterium]
MDKLNLTANLLENESLTLDNKMFRNRLRARKATPKDLNEIYHIACSVGKNKKDSNQGFLMDDYSSDPKYYQKRLMESILELDHFYVAESYNNKIVGFLMAYTKEQWLKYNENWIEEVFWHPSFDKSKIEDFILIDKTAIYAPLTGHGIGSKLYELLIQDILKKGIHDILAETIISPLPNFASLAFRKKQDYTLAGTRYEDYKGETYTDLIYHKSV